LHRSVRDERRGTTRRGSAGRGTEEAFRPVRRASRFIQAPASPLGLPCLVTGGPPHRYGRTLLEYFLAGLGAYLRRSYARRTLLPPSPCRSIRGLFSLAAGALAPRRRIVAPGCGMVEA